MLQIKNISKTYITGDLKQDALQNVSLNLRDNEFIAILGPSGSGKTTLLNIIGGLDRYDEGDMVINGISTKNYKEKDWNAYRNHTVGFVFQSYNLIPHQSVLANVELALTISGISSSERRERAKEALRQVGLYEQMHKKPNQMSGGQMQRVAIARALVNNPDIVLADEPTGALDSETSLQVMDLLKEVARDRLVVMVTHNPELANTYANRIVQLKDGKIISDTNPYINDSEEAVHKNMGKSSMSFLTALSLSFNNLWSKRARTILVSLAGSIGIIGIALILSLSNGVNNYIKGIEEETLSEYPLQIQSTGFNFGMMVENNNDNDTETVEEVFEVKEAQMVNTMFSRMNSNDLKSLKDYFDSGESHIENYVSDIEYSYDVIPHIYRVDDKEYRQINPDSTFSSLGFGNSASISNSYLSSMMSSDVFYALPASKKLYENQYDIKAGHWPENSNELVLVLSSGGRVSDFMLYAIGFKDSKDLDEMVNQFAQDETIVSHRGDAQTYKYEDFIGVTFKLLHSSDYYEYDSEYEIYVDKSGDKKYMRKLLDEAEDLVISGVVQPKEDATAAMLAMGINYPYSLQEKIINYADNSDIVKAQTANSKKDIFTGTDFGEDKENEMGMESLFTVDEDKINEAFSFDTSALSFDPSAFNISPNIDMSSLNFEAPKVDNLDLESMLSNIDVKVNEEELNKLSEEMFKDYSTFLNDNYSDEINNIQEAGSKYLSSPEAQATIANSYQDIMKDLSVNLTSEEVTAIFNKLLVNAQAYIIEKGATTKEEIIEATTEYLSGEEALNIMNEEMNKIISNNLNNQIDPTKVSETINALSTGYQKYIEDNYSGDIQKIGESFNKYLGEEDVQKTITNNISKVVNMDEIENQITNVMNNTTGTITSSIQNQITLAMQNIMGQITYSIQSSMTNMMSDLPNQLKNAFSFDANKFSEAITMSKSEKEIQEIMMQMMSSETSTYDGNLRKLGYANLSKPNSISIYPLDFNSKEEVLSILDKYNERMAKEDDEKVIRYTDTVGVLMSGVTDIIDAISYVLVAFVAISLIVSSIMIGVITYISVLERRKEIGILRSIGASKRNISEVFNAETFIIGLFAGLFGVIIYYLFQLTI